jgi:Short C-terminal domain
MTSRRLAKISLALAIVLMVGGIIGFVGTLTLNAFVLDKYNAYGEVQIPGSGTIHLPAGEATISFHTMTVGNTSGGGLPVPRLSVDIVPPQGVAQPTLTENYGTTTTVNNDAHIRVWIMRVSAEGDYQITTDGQVNGYISPQLAFGHGGTSSSSKLLWLSGILFVVGLIGTIAGPIWLARTRVASVGNFAPPYSPIDLGPPPVAAPSPESSLPTHASGDEGVKLEQLKTLAALRDSGALTEAEFETEKRRILDGR